MINKNAFKAKVEKQGNIVVIRVAGDGSCLWLNMYLDCDNGQLTCDSDSGSYAYHWGRGYDTSEIFPVFCCRWLANEEWLLRKCIREQHIPLVFNAAKTEENLRRQYADYHGIEYPNNYDYGQNDLEEALEEASSCSDRVDAWVTAFESSVDRTSVDLPVEWHECIAEDYTPQQKRFAEICREIIAPALKQFCEYGGA